jgi:hypothetical protein
LGAHATPTSRLYLDVDLLQHTQLVDTSTSPNQLSEVRVVAGYALAPHVSVFAGPTYNVLVASNLSRADAPGIASPLGNSSSTDTRGWPGVTLGVEGL